MLFPDLKGQKVAGEEVGNQEKISRLNVLIATGKVNVYDNEV